MVLNRAILLSTGTSTPPPPSTSQSSLANSQTTIQIPMLGNIPGPNSQQNQQQQQGPQNSNIPPPPPQNGQNFTLSSVLHFLQTEWRAYERDRNEWEIERAEMRARIALLEGERRSFENVKLDLLRRIKMLEYALRMERSKQLTQATPSVPPAKFALLQSQAAATSQKDDAQSHRDSSGSSPRSDDSPLPDTRIPNGLTDRGPSGRPNSWGAPNWPNGPASTSAAAALGKPPPGRDPKSRARSRDYLKQCLQEISYLTSPQAMNPLPNRPLLNNPSLPLSLPNLPSFDQMPPYNGRPRKVMPEIGGKDFPMLNGISLMSGPSSSSAAPGGQIHPLDRSIPLGSGLTQSNAPQTGALGQQQQQTHTPSSAAQSLQPLLVDEDPNKEGTGDAEPRQQLTAIFRPDDAGEWKEKLRLSHEAAEQARMGGAATAASAAGLSAGGAWDRRPRFDDEDVKEDEGDVEDEDSTVVGEDEGSKVWKAKRTLRNHLDAVRAIAFHPAELCLATGGDDCTVKIWRMDVASLTASSARVTTEVEPQITLRGHSAAITRLIHSPSKRLLYSASLDSSIRVWALPPPSHTTYAPYDEMRARGELVGHTDAVWDLALVRDESTLISCGAEGAVKVWDVSGAAAGSSSSGAAPGSLRLTWGWAGVQENGTSGAMDDSHPGGENVDAPGATAVEALKADLKTVAVAYQNSVVKIFDIETGKEVTRLATDATYDGTPATQINCIVSHPTMPLLVTAHEDKYIRIFDVVTGQCTHSMLAHLDGVTSLSIDASGFSLVSGSHDCSIRFWDLLGTRACVQEITTHREKAREGVLGVEFHPSLPLMASAGADGVVKLYASS